MTSAVRRVWRRDAGSQLIEFMLVFPMLLLMVAAIMDFGMLMRQYEVITNAAREAARFGATVAEQQCEPVSECGGLTWAQLVRSLA